MEEVGHYDVGLVCFNGHKINDCYSSELQHNAKFCRECGQPTTSKCSKCGTSIRGLYHDESSGIDMPLPWISIPQYCHECGTAYPWTERRRNALVEAIDELSELDEGDRGRLKESVPDVIQETPKTQIAITRF